MAATALRIVTPTHTATRDSRRAINAQRQCHAADEESSCSSGSAVCHIVGAQPPPDERIVAGGPRMPPSTSTATGQNNPPANVPCAPRGTKSGKSIDRPVGDGYAASMDMSETGKHTDDLNAVRHDTIGGVLAAAVSMEEDISAGVYRDYLRRENWPEQLDEDAFAEIRKRLTVLIKGIEKHKRIINALVREHGRNK